MKGIRIGGEEAVKIVSTSSGSKIHKSKDMPKTLTSVLSDVVGSASEYNPFGPGGT